MRAHLLGATAVGAAGAGLFSRQQRSQQHGWARRGCATPSPAGSYRRLEWLERRLERLERQLQPTRLPPWLAAVSLVSYCSAAARDGAPEAAPPQQFSLMRMAGDGRCLFRALATGAHLLENAGSLAGVTFEQQTQRADALRHATCKELLARRADLEPFIDEDFDTYVARMQQPRTWGGEPELAVAHHVLKRPVSVYSVQQGGLSLVSRYGAEEHQGAEDIPLLFHGGGHYDLLVKGETPQARL